jgi:hypothetical protein
LWSLLPVVKLVLSVNTGPDQGSRMTLNLFSVQPDAMTDFYVFAEKSHGMRHRFRKIQPEQPQRFPLPFPFAEIF